MKDERKTKKQLIAELEELRKRNGELEASDTERKQMEETLRLERDKLTNILDSMEDGTYIVNSKYEIEYVNPVLQKELGPYEGKKCFEYRAGREDVCLGCKLQDVIAGKITHEELFYAKNQRTYDLVGTPLRNPDGSISELMIFRDITDRMKTEEELRKFKAISDNANYGVAIVDLEGNLVYVNEAWARMHGYSPHELIGKHLSIFHHESEMERVNELNRRLVEEGGFVAEEVAHKRKDGTVFPTLMTSSQVTDENGKVLVLSATAVDISELKRAEEEIKKKNLELEAALKVKSEFMSMISHELRTPLVPIVGYSELLLDGSMGEVPEEAIGPLKAISSCAEDLTTLIEDLLTLSTMERGKLRINMESVSVGKHISEMATDYQQMVHVKPVAIEWVGDDFVVTADHTRFHQVLRNLIDNAIKYSEESVEISISTETRDDFCCISVADNGLGISEEHLPYIFDRFYQAENVDTRVHSGSGLGLAVTKEMTEAMGGRITVESEAGKGSTFTVALPLADGP